MSELILVFEDLIKNPAVDPAFHCTKTEEHVYLITTHDMKISGLADLVLRFSSKRFFSITIYIEPLSLVQTSLVVFSKINYIHLLLLFLGCSILILNLVMDADSWSWFRLFFVWILSHVIFYYLYKSYKDEIVFFIRKNIVRKTFKVRNRRR